MFGHLEIYHVYMQNEEQSQHIHNERVHGTSQPHSLEKNDVFLLVPRWVQLFNRSLTGGESLFSVGESHSLFVLQIFS